MQRRAFLALLAASLATGPARAADPVAAIVGELERRGYTQISVSRTLLGRARILARGPQGRREIILNPATGEILRDLRESAALGADAAELLGEGGAPPRPGRDPGGDRPDDDDDHDDNDDDGDDGDDGDD